MKKIPEIPGMNPLGEAARLDFDVFCRMMTAPCIFTKVHGDGVVELIDPDRVYIVPEKKNYAKKAEKA